MARNTNRQGANFELDVMHYLSGCSCETTYTRPHHVGWTGFGYECLRSSGSRGAIDIVAVASATWRPVDEDDSSNLLFIQCKISKAVISPAERQRVQDLATRASAVPLVAFRAQDADTGRVRPHFRMLTGPGPKDWSAWEPERDES